MQIIPVIDLLDGIVVHAKHGDRENYLPLNSVLCKSPDLLELVNVYQQQLASNIIYIADLNAIMKQGNNADLFLIALKQKPEITFWIDAGYPLTSNQFENYKNYLPVLGSESFQNDSLDEILNFNKKFVLSLDFSLKGQMGATSLFVQPEYWPQNVIIMTLAKVGSNSGPDVEKISYYRSRYPNFNFIASGGVRDYRDLIRLEKIGVQQTLVATALHNGKLSPFDVADLR